MARNYYPQDVMEEVMELWYPALITKVILALKGMIGQMAECRDAIP